MKNEFLDADAPTPVDKTAAAPLFATARGLSDGVPPILRKSGMRRPGWVCIPMEDELEGAAAARLASACAGAGFSEAWAVEVPWTAEQAVVGAFRLPLTVQGVVALTKDALLGSGFVLAEAKGGFVLASDGDLYWMLAGPRSFVEAACGGTVDDRLARFGAVVEAYRRPGSLAGLRVAAVQQGALQAAV